MALMFLGYYVCLFYVIASKMPQSTLMCFIPSGLFAGTLMMIFVFLQDKSTLKQ